MNQHPHQNQPVVTAGMPLDQAKTAMILVHGRGATAASILTLADELDRPDFAYLAPQAANNTWYPYSFLSPISQNEPGITSGMTVIHTLLNQIITAGFPIEKTMLLGFSQGACLAVEFAARHAQRFGGLVGLSGGLIGPDGTPRNYAGSLEGTPVFLGCSDVDFHIPQERVAHSAEVLQQLGGDVTMRLYPGMGHTINLDEIAFVQSMMDSVMGVEDKR
jgi:predicted esterase